VVILSPLFLFYNKVNIFKTTAFNQKKLDLYLLSSVLVNTSTNKLERYAEFLLALIFPNNERVTIFW